jgi:hypothetical protein
LNKKYSVMLNEIIDPWTIGAGLVYAAQKAKDKIFGKSEKTEKSNTNKDSKDLKDDKEIKSNTSNSKNIWEKFETNYLDKLRSVKKVIKYVYLRDHEKFDFESKNEETLAIDFNKKIEQLKKGNSMWSTEWDNKYNGKILEITKLLKTEGFLNKLKQDMNLEYKQIKEAEHILAFVNK